MNRLHEDHMAQKLRLGSNPEVPQGLEPMEESLEHELEAGAKVIAKQQLEHKQRLHEHISSDINQFAIRGSEKQWKEATSSVFQAATESISVKVGEKRIGESVSSNDVKDNKKSKKGDGKFGKGWKKPKSGKGRKD